MKAFYLLLLGTALSMNGTVAGEDPGLPSGSYTGTAEWRGPQGSSGTYEVKKTFTGPKLNARYSWSGERSGEENISVEFVRKSGEPTFEVRDEAGQVVGTGHCYDDACAYRAKFGPVEVEESFRWTKDEMTVLGSKSGPGFSVVWKETLQAR